MNKILIGLLEKVGITSVQDKVLHFTAGFIIAVIVILITGISWVGLIAGFTAGVLKEVYDQYSYGGADFFDFFATLAGTFAGAVLVEAMM